MSTRSGKMPKQLLKYWAKKRSKQRNVELAGVKLPPGSRRSKILRRTRKAVRSVIPAGVHGSVRFNPKTVVARANPHEAGSHLVHKAQYNRARHAWNKLVKGQISQDEFNRYVLHGGKLASRRTARKNPTHKGAPRKKSMLSLRWMLG